MSRRDEILSALADIEFLSSPATTALQLMSDPNATPMEIGRALELDPALTTNILRFANSAYFGCSNKVLTVKDAVIRLGIAIISRMLFLSSAQQFSSKPVRGYGLAPGGLWDSMISTAVGTDLLAKTLGIRPPHYAFTVGLLHNIGKIVLGTYLEVDSRPICLMVEDENIPFDEAERIVLGIDHAEVGAALLSRWAIPKEIVHAVRWYLDPDQCSDDKVVVDLVHVANAISLMAGSGLGIDGLCYNMCESSQKRLGINAETIQLVLCDLSAEIQRLTHME